MSSAPQLVRYSVGSGVTAFSTTRHGGFSTGNYGEMNVNPYCGDEPDAVAKNRTLLCSTLGIADERLILPHQNHGIEVRQIAPEFLSLPVNVRAMLLEGVDALMTDVPQVCIGVSTADCIPILLYDSANRACCAVHSGWRGTVARIVQKAVAAMAAAYKTRPDGLSAVVGPGISVDCFEVGNEVYEEFASAGFDMPGISRMTDKWHIDLPECCHRQLVEAGLHPENIQMSDECTYSNTDKYFSARRLGAASGRIFTGIMLKG